MTDSMEMSRRDLIDGLRRFQEDFNKDFSIRDVYNELNNNLKKEELQFISRLHSSEAKIDRLFFYYIYIKRDVWPLVKSLQDSYQWIYMKILSSTNDKWISDYRRAIQDIPNNQDYNVHRTEYLWRIQQELKALRRGDYLILFGKLGHGKKWLAADACRDYGVVYKMDFKIYWLNVSKCTTYELILDKLHRLKVLLQADDLDIKYSAYSGNSKNESIHVKTHLRKVLERPEYKNCLIVLTDVQDEKVVKAFDLNCKMLLTTCHREEVEKAITKEKQTMLEINKGLSQCESVELFTKVLRKEDKYAELTQSMSIFIEDIHKKCSGHPMTMSLIAKTFQKKEDENKRKERCINWISNLENYESLDEYEKIKMSVKETMTFLTEKQRKCYRQMVIFTDNIEVPVDVLAKLWDTSINDAETIVQKFHNYSLIERQVTHDSCSLHFVHYKYLKEEISETDQIQFHQQLIEKYEVRNTFLTRTQLELEFPEDNYFHFYIGYHIAGAREYDLFDLYLDFGFLEEKIRIAKLPNTLGDLMKFKDEIERNKNRQDLLEELKYFLATAEQLLFKSDDMTLLQIALTYEGPIKEEAQRQITKYHDRLWMKDINHIESYSQMFALQADAQPRLVRFVKLNTFDPLSEDNLVCLISLQDNNILLHDIATDYSEGPILYKNDHPHSTIMDMQIFRNQAFLVLNDNGKLSVYYLKSSAARRPSAPTKFHTNETINDRQPFVIEYNSGRDKFTCFNLIETQGADLIVGTAKGVIKLYKWIQKSNKFEDIKTDIKTGFHDLFRMTQIHDYVMLLNCSGDAKFVNLIDSAHHALNIKWQKQENPVNLHQGRCAHSNRPITLCVSADRVMQINHEVNRSFPETPLILLEYEEIYSNDLEDSKILSSAMSKDAEFLILGTYRGIMIINRFEKKIVCRRNVSDQVMSLDVFRCSNEAFFYLVSVFKDAGKMISFQGFDSTRDDLPNRKTHFLVGENLFDVRKNLDEWSLIAADTKNQIFTQTLNDNDDIEELQPLIKFPYQIKRICYDTDESIVVGCTNGSVYRIMLENVDVKLKMVQLTGEITYMEKFNNAIIVSCNSCYQILGMGEDIVYGKATKAFAYKDNTLLVVKKDCSIEFLDTEEKRLYGERMLVEKSTCVAQAYNNSLLAIATSKKNVYFWRVNEEIVEEREQLSSIKNQIVGEISSIAISADSHVIAVGCFDGNIELFDIQELVPIYTLESHNKPIMNLQFSPWLETEGPVILLSLAESVNFWNITHIQNNYNGMKRNSRETKIRVSQRFKSPYKITPFPIETQMRKLSLKERNWSNKTGPHIKRELLSCIKFLGKSAKKVVASDDFTRFVTIDNEGNIHHLRLIDQQSSDELQINIDFNGNSSNGHTE